MCITSNFKHTFLSTLSLRRATTHPIGVLVRVVHFYPRSPCGERPVGVLSCYLDNIISIHALLAESDGHDPGGGRISQGFLSTLSLRRATSLNISRLARVFYFYPRSPCGERQTSLVVIGTNCIISIHALLAESDVRRLPWQISIKYFYPRSPCGERHHCHRLQKQVFAFLSTLSLRRATKIPLLCFPTIKTFLSTLSLRRATRHGVSIIVSDNHFYPRSPCGERPWQVPA